MDNVGDSHGLEPISQAGLQEDDQGKRIGNLQTANALET